MRAGLVDTEPDFPAPPVESDGAVRGRLDMREWRRTTDAVDASASETVPGLFEVAAARHPRKMAVHQKQSYDVEETSGLSSKSERPANGANPPP